MSINRYIYCTDVQKLLEKKYFNNLDINRQSLFLPSLTLARFAWIDVVSVVLRLTCSYIFILVNVKYIFYFFTSK